MSNLSQPVLKLDEIFRTCYEGYEISNYGTLRRVPHGSGKGKLSYLYAKGSTTIKGYLAFKLYLPSGKKTVVGHRLVAQSFLPNPLSLPQVNHLDGNKLNNCVTNLEWCTNTENSHHAHRLGLIDTRGERSARNKYSEKIVRLALETKNTISHAMFSKKYKIPATYVSAIRCGDRWNWLYKEYYGETSVK